MQTPYKIGLLGSTSHTLTSVQSLLKDTKFKIDWVLTPSVKPQGRNQKLMPNPVQKWAQRHQIPQVLIDTTIDAQVESDIQTLVNQTGRPDFLLIVDFGYQLPDWLIKLPQIESVNIHPSDLPRWRGSSPGQFALLYGEKTTTVSVITMTEKFDQGDIVYKLPLPVQPNWTQVEYYQTCFSQISSHLPNLLNQLAHHQITPQPQALVSPTATARRLSKNDAFVDWQNITGAQAGGHQLVKPLNPLLNLVLLTLQKSDQKKSNSSSIFCQLLEQAVRAFSPWPHVWTFIPTANGQKRMKILKTSLNQSGKLILEIVQIEGQQPASWNQIKNIIQLA